MMNAAPVKYTEPECSVLGKPVRIDFYLVGPMIVPSTDKSLDALLSWAAVQQAVYQDKHNPISHQDNTGLARHVVDPEWCPAASYLQYEWVSPPFVHHYIKRSKLTDYAAAWDEGILSKRPYFNAAQGPTKAGSYVQQARWAIKITGYALVADEARLVELLPWVTHIGKLHHKDWGRVGRFEVSHDVVALTQWSDRNLPAKSIYAKGYASCMGALRSPYWKRENHGLIAVPN